MQHKSGIVSDDEGNNAPKEYQDNNIRFYYIIQQGVNKDNIGKRDYNNFRIAIVGILIAAIAYPEEVAKFHRDHKHLDHVDYTIALGNVYLSLYEKYMREVVFSQAFESIAPTCRPESELPDNPSAVRWKPSDKAPIEWATVPFKFIKLMEVMLPNNAHVLKNVEI